MKKSCTIVKRGFAGCFITLFCLLFFGMLVPVRAQIPAMENPCDQITVPYEGYDYTANLFGSVCWFTQNMRNTKYADGSDIPDVRAYMDDESYVPEFGRLYTWSAATRLPAGVPTMDSVQGLCPDGWYIPRAVDFQNLSTRVGGADAMKSADPSYWLGLETGLSPADGFNGQPGGLYKAENGRYENILGEGHFWSSTSTTVLPLACSLQHGCPQALISEYNAGNGFSVRCVKYYYPPVLAQDLALSNPTFTTVDAKVSLASSGSQVPVVKFYVYTNFSASGTPVLETDYIDAVMTATDTTYSVTLTPLLPGTSYYVKAIAYNFFGESTSNIADTTTLKLMLESDHNDAFSSCSDTVRYTATVTGDYELADMQYAWTSGPLAGTVSPTGDEMAVYYSVTTKDTVLCKATYRGTFDSVLLVTDATITTTPVIRDTAISVGSKMYFSFIPDSNMTGNIIPAATKYSWAAPTSTTITGMMPGSNTKKFSQTLINQGSITQTVVYTLTPSNTVACVGEPFEVEVTVIPMTSFCGVTGASVLGDNESGTLNHLDSVRDYDGNWYKVLQIGNQCWMKQNLRSAHDASGNSISYQVPNGGVNSELYGYLYDKNSMMNGGSPSTLSPSGVRGVCPKGWHIPSRAEWETMLTALDFDADNNCGGMPTRNTKALAINSCWNTSTGTCAVGNDLSANNHSGFSAVPAGHCFGGSFKELNDWAHFWTCTQGADGGNSDRNYVYNIEKSYSVASKETWLSSGYANFDTYYGYSQTSVSVRCVRDAVAFIGGMSCPGEPTVTDVDGNVYNTVLIGDQCWMRENLKTTRFADGSDIGLGTNYSSTTPLRYDPDRNADNVSDYGYLYNWLAVMNGVASSNTNPSNVQGICPNGWHVPSDAEWVQLFDYVSSQSAFVCGGNTAYIAKSLADIMGWKTGSNNCAVGNNQSANNATGFGARPAGYHESESNFGNNSYFWSSTEASATRAYYRSLNYYRANTQENPYDKKYTLSVRCVSNAGNQDADPPTVTTNTPSDITSVTASCGGNVITSGGANVTARGVCWSTSPNPTLSDSHTTDGTGTGSFISSLTGLASGTVYYVRAYASNSAGTEYGNEVSFTTLDLLPGGQPPVSEALPCPSAPTVTDVDGNVYNTVQIGGQCWMRENLRTTRYADGEEIPLRKTTSATSACRFNPNNDANNVPLYGYLYNWIAVMHGETTSGVQGICPDGWHVPSNADWTQLTNYVSGQSSYMCGGNSHNIAKALAATSGWATESNSCAVGNDQSVNNATGFSARPAGYHSSPNNFGNTAYFWSSTEASADNANYRSINYFVAVVHSYNYEKKQSLSVRCLKD